jgi:hypothetical protein
MPSRLLGRSVGGLVSYTGAGIATLLLSRIAGGPTDLLLPFAVLLAGAIIPVALVRFESWRVLCVTFLVILLGTLLSIWFDALPVRPYGDGRLMVDFMLPRAYVYPRWLLGMALAVALYVGVWQFAPIATRLPTQLATPAAFGALLCSIAMAVGSIAVLERWRSLAVVFAMLTPVWLLFSTGYVEYYPLMIVAWLAAIAWTFERPLGERDPLPMGCVIGLMPAIYAGLIGFSAVVFLAYAVIRPSRALPALGAAAASLGIATSVAYPSTAQYLQQLHAEMNFGEEHLAFARYAGHSAGPHSIFFTSSYAVSPEHLCDVAYMMFWSGGWLFLPVAAVALAMMPSKRVRWRAAVRDARFWVFVAIAAWQSYYMLHMIPLAGPTHDVDLFSPTVVMFAFGSGWLVDRGIAEDRWRHRILCALVGVDVVTGVFLAGIGLPQRL